MAIHISLHDFNGKVVWGTVLPQGYGRWFAFYEELRGRYARDTTELLTQASEKLGCKPNKDKWHSTKGNVGIALKMLLKKSLEEPNSRWEVVE